MVRKRPLSFCPECSWQITSKRAYSLYPPTLDWAEYANTHEQFGNLSENKLTENSSGYTPPQSSQDAEPLSNYPGLISERELVTTFSLTKSQMRGESCRTFNSAQVKLSLPPNVHHHSKRRHAHRDAQKQAPSKCILSVQESERTRYSSRKTLFFSWRYCTIPTQIAPQEQTRSIHNYA